MRIAIMLPNWIGDVVMATPALRSLRRHFRCQAELIGIARPYVVPVLDGLAWLDRVEVYDPRSSDRDMSVAALVRRLRSLRLDTIVLLTNSLRTAWIAWRSGARQRVGYRRGGRSWLLTDTIEAPRSGGKWQPISAVDYYLRLAEYVGCPSEPRRLQLATTVADETLADTVWLKSGLSRVQRVVALNPGGAYGAAKHWPPEYFAALARGLVNQADVGVLVLCGPAERETAARVAQLADHDRVVSLADERLSLGLSKACVRRSDLLVTTDSGPRHFAAAFGVPAVTIFGSTDPRWSWNYHPGETILQSDLDCAPCARRTCPLRHHRCMRDRTPESVLAVARDRLVESSQEKAA